MSWIAAILLAGMPIQAPTHEEVTLTGQAILLTEALGAVGVSVEAAPIARQVVLKSSDTGAVVPLLPDEASRALFEDERLRDRPIRLQGRRYDGLPYVLVTSVRVEEDGAWRVPEYYCDVCTISVRYPQVCPCCQGEMELRMRPEDR